MLTSNRLCTIASNNKPKKDFVVQVEAANDTDMLSK